MQCMEFYQKRYVPTSLPLHVHSNILLDMVFLTNFNISFRTFYVWLSVLALEELEFVKKEFFGCSNLCNVKSNVLFLEKWTEIKSIFIEKKSNLVAQHDPTTFLKNLLQNAFQKNMKLGTTLRFSASHTEWHFLCCVALLNFVWFFPRFRLHNGYRYYRYLLLNRSDLTIHTHSSKGSDCYKPSHCSFTQRWHTWAKVW